MVPLAVRSACDLGANDPFTPKIDGETRFALSKPERCTQADVDRSCLTVSIGVSPYVHCAQLEVTCAPTTAQSRNHQSRSPFPGRPVLRCRRPAGFPLSTEALKSSSHCRRGRRAFVCVSAIGQDIVSAFRKMSTKPDQAPLFEGRTLPRWERHVVLTAIAYSFLQRTLPPSSDAADPAGRARRDDRRAQRTFSRHAPASPEVDAETQRSPTTKLTN
jgi:hypothetical protein